MYSGAAQLVQMDVTLLKPVEPCQFIPAAHVPYGYLFHSSVFQCSVINTVTSPRLLPTSKLCSKSNGITDKASWVGISERCYFGLPSVHLCFIHPIQLEPL